MQLRTLGAIFPSSAPHTNPQGTSHRSWRGRRDGTEEQCGEISVDTTPSQGEARPRAQLRGRKLPPGREEAPSWAEGHPAAESGRGGEGRLLSTTLQSPPTPGHAVQTHLQRVHHTIGQHGHLPGHRLDALLKLGDVSRGQHIPQGHAACKRREGVTQRLQEALPSPQGPPARLAGPPGAYSAPGPPAP